MTHKYRIAAIGTLVIVALIAALIGGAYYATQRVAPYYEQALRIEPQVLEEGRRELESRATALYSDVKQVGRWQALFTAEQINGWLATQLRPEKGAKLPPNIHDPRVAITPETLTLGFRTKSSGVETVISVDASVLLTEEGHIGVRFLSVRAGSLPLPVMQLADELADACQRLKLPVRWTQEKNQPIAIVHLANDSAANDREFFVDTIELRENEMYVAGHTEAGKRRERATTPVAESPKSKTKDVALDDHELRPAPSEEAAALEIARRPVKK